MSCEEFQTMTHTGLRSSNCEAKCCWCGTVFHLPGAEALATAAAAEWQKDWDESLASGDGWKHHCGSPQRPARHPLVVSPSCGSPAANEVGTVPLLVAGAAREQHCLSCSLWLHQQLAELGALPARRKGAFPREICTACDAGRTLVVMSQGGKITLLEWGSSRNASNSHEVFHGPQLWLDSSPV